MSIDNRDLKALIVGGGSIGQRHARNLQSLGVDVGLYDVNAEKARSICNENGYSFVSDLSNAQKSGEYSVALICTPNHLHVPIAQEFVDAGVNIFIEKPLSHSMAGIEKLISTVESRNLIAMAAFNLRFEVGLQYLKSHLNCDNVAFVLIESGSHMPLWRKGVDYRTTYSAQKEMGGGVILDDVHEIDYACWLFGYPENVMCNFGKFSGFEINVEDTADIIFQYRDKSVMIHSDYIQRSYSRTCKICDRDGYTTRWEFGKSVTIQTPGNNHIFNYQSEFDVNDMYIREMELLIHSLRTGSQPELDLMNSKTILEIALRCKGELS